jgi:hypothetical protein
MCLMLAGYAGHNLPSNVPLEFLAFNSHEDAHPFVRNVLNPLLKRLMATLTNVSFGGSRRRVRKQLGLPPLSPPALRKEDGSSSGVLNSWAGQMAAQPVIPRVIYLAGVSWEMVSDFCMHFSNCVSGSFICAIACVCCHPLSKRSPASAVANVQQSGHRPVLQCSA